MGRIGSDELSEPTSQADAAVYALHALDFEVVYAGQAGAGEEFNLARRLAQHQRDHLAHRGPEFRCSAAGGRTPPDE